MPDGALSCTKLGIGIGVAVDVVDADVGAAGVSAVGDGNALAGDGGALDAVDSSGGVAQPERNESSPAMKSKRRV